MISLLRGAAPKFSRYAIVTAGAGIPIQYVCAVMFMLFYNGFNIKAALISVAAFIPGDILKCLIASAAGVALNKNRLNIS